MFKKIFWLAVLLGSAVVLVNFMPRSWTQKGMAKFAEVKAGAGKIIEPFFSNPEEERGKLIEELEAKLAEIQKINPDPKAAELVQESAALLSEIKAKNDENAGLLNLASNKLIETVANQINQSFQPPPNCPTQ